MSRSLRSVGQDRVEPVRLERRGLRVVPVPLELVQERLDRLAQLEQQVLMGRPVVLEVRVQPGRPAGLVRRVVLALQGRQDQPEPQDRQVLRVRLALQARRVRQVLRVLRVRRERPVGLEAQGLPGIPAIQEEPVERPQPALCKVRRLLGLGLIPSPDPQE